MSGNLSFTQELRQQGLIVTDTETNKEQKVTEQVNKKDNNEESFDKTVM